MSTSLDYGEYVAIVYASLQSCGLLSTSLYVLLKSSSSGCMERLKEIWSYKWIYTSSLSTIYDQATDIGVTIYWYSLIDNNDIEHVDMMLLFVLSCIFLCISRLFNMWGACDMIKSSLLGLFLGMFDLLIVTFVWGKITKNKNVFEEMKQDTDELSCVYFLQMAEVLLETLPQILLQSLFLIRTFDNDVIYDTSNQFNIYLVWISLFISVISATNKISHVAMTGGDVSERDKFENKYYIRTKCPIINIGILSKKIYFISTIITRLFLYALLWSVCGGMFVTLFFVICWIVFVVCVKRGFYETEDVGLEDGDVLFLVCAQFLPMEAFGFRANFDHESSESKQFFIYNTLNLIVLLLILYFGIDNSFDCSYNLCADKKIRSFNHNAFAFVVFCIIIFTFLLQIVLYFLMPKFVQLSQQWEDDYQSKKQATKSNEGTMVDIQTSPKQCE